MKHIFKIFSLFLIMLLIACGGKEKPSSEQEATSETASTSTVVEVAISGNDLMQYDKKVIEVAAGSTIKLTLTHSGSMTKEIMGHNFVLLQAGVDLDAFAIKALAAKETAYIPADQAADIIINTTIVGGGESVPIEFAAPAAGTYKFRCTFPGHYAMMQGDFIVK